MGDGVGGVVDSRNVDVVNVGGVWWDDELIEGDGVVWDGRGREVVGSERRRKVEERVVWEIERMNRREIVVWM